MDARELLSVRGLVRAFSERRLSPVELMRHTLAQITNHNGLLNAIYEIDEESAMASARQSEQRWIAGQPAGLLDGIPTTAKDGLALAGFRSFRGTAAGDPRPAPAVENAPVHQRLLDQGAIMLGKSTMCDLGILPSGFSSRHGITRNPWHTDLTPGGSSSGAAAAVAAGMHSFAIGTDIVGSIRLPAAFTGLFGFKPSQGRVPYHPQNSPALVAGPMSHHVQDAALLMNIIAAPDARDFTSLASDGTDYLAALERPMPVGRVGVVRDLGFAGKPSAECLAALEAAVALLVELGWQVTDLDGPFDEDDLVASENFYRVRADFELRRSPDRGLAGCVNSWALAAAGASASDLYGWYLVQQQCRLKASQLISGCDYLLLPSTLSPALAAEFPQSPEVLFRPWSQTFLFNLSEQPAASLPMGLSKDGLPLGVQIVGRRHDDQGVLSLSAALERARGPSALSPMARNLASAPAKWPCSHVPFH